MLSNTNVFNRVRASNTGKNWRTALFLFSQLALSSTILGEEPIKHASGEGEDSSLYLQERNSRKDTIQQQFDEMDTEDDESQEGKENGSYDSHKITRVSGGLGGISLANPHNGLLSSIRVLGNANSFSRGFINNSFRLITPQPVNIIEQVYLTEMPEEQIVLFPDNQLRFLGGIQNWFEGDYGMSGLGLGHGVKGDDEIDEQVAVFPGSHKNRRTGEISKSLPPREHEEYSHSELIRIEEKLDRLIQEAAVGHKGISKGSYHFGKGSNKELDVLSAKVEELIRTVGGISKQNRIIGEQTSKTYSISTKTFNEVSTLNEKLEQLRRGVSKLSDAQQHNTQQQSIAIVKSSKDVTEINTRLTELLRAVGRLSKDGTFQMDSGYTESGKNDSEHDYELKEIRSSIRGLQSALDTITKEVSNVVGKISGISDEDHDSILLLKKELGQIKSLLQSSIGQTRTSEKQEIKLVSEVLENQSINFKALSGNVGRLIESLNVVAQEVHNESITGGKNSARIYKELGGLGKRLNEVYSSLASLVKKETLLAGEHRSDGNHSFDGKNISVITSEFESLKELIKGITSKQLEFVKENYGNQNKDSKLENPEIVGLLNRIQNECEELIDGQQKILNERESNSMPTEFLRDINGMARAMMTLRTVIQNLFKEQAVLIKSKAPYGDEKWAAFNEKLTKLDKLLLPLSEQNRWLQQQSTLITKMDGNLVDLGKKINYLIQEQANVSDLKETKPGNNYPANGDGKVVRSLASLRTMVQTLVESQKTLLEQYRNPSIPKELAKDIGSINYRLADISNIVDRLIKERKELPRHYGSDGDQPATDGTMVKAVNALNSRVNQLVEVVELISRQQKSLLNGKSVGIDFNSTKGNGAGLNARLQQLGERIDFIIKQQESIFARFRKEHGEEYNGLRGILDKLRMSVQSISKERRIVYRESEGEDKGTSVKYDREIDALEQLTSKIYQVIERVATDQQQILKNEDGQSQNIEKINGKLSQLSEVVTLVFEQQKRLSNGGFKSSDYSKDVNRLSEQLRVLREKTAQMIELQEKSLKNAKYSSQGDLLKLGEQLSIIKQAVGQFYSGQEKLLGVVAKESTSQKVLENEERIAERVDQLTTLVKRLADDQIALLSGSKGKVNMDLRGFLGRLGKLDEIVKILNSQQSYTVRLLELVPLIREEAEDIKKINGQMGTLRNLLEELSSLEKADLGTDRETLKYVKQTTGRLSQIYSGIEGMVNSQKEILGYLENGTSIKGIDGIREMGKKITMLTEATRIVLNEVKSTLSQLGSTTKLVAQNTQQIDAKVEQLSLVVQEVSKKQNSLLKQIAQLSQSQDKNFRVVNQRLNTLGQDINQLTSQQREILEKYGNDVEKLFGITDAKLVELRKSIELMINEQRKLAYHISESKGVNSKEIVEELSKLDGGMDQLTRYVRGLLDQQNKLLAYTQEDNAMIKNHGKELRAFGDRMNKLYDLVARVAETQKHLITREEVVALFKEQTGDIKNLSLELAEIGNQIIQLLKQQKSFLGHEDGQNGELNVLKKALSQVSESVRKVLVQQNILLQSGWDKVPKELLNNIEALRSQFRELGEAVTQMSKKQDYLIQQQSGDTKYILNDIDQVKKNLSGLSKLVEKVAQFQLEIIKRGGLTPEQAQDLKNIKSELSVLDRKVASLVEQQHQLVTVLSKDGHVDDEKFARIAQNLAELRKIVYELTSQQTDILSRRFSEALGQKIPEEIVRLNNKLVGLHKDIDQIQALQKELFVQSRKDTKLIVGGVEKLDARLAQLGSYVKELFAEQRVILLNNTELLKQSLGKTNLLTNEVKNLDKKIETLVKIQYDLLKRINGENKLDSEETKRILQGLSGLQSLISQLIEQQKKLVSASLSGKLTESTLRRLEVLNEKYAQLVEAVNQITASQKALFQLSRDSNATEHHLEGQVEELNKRLLGLFDFIRQTFSEQTEILNTREITALLKDQNRRIANLGAKLSELGNQFDKMVNEQEVIVNQLGKVSSEDTQRDRAIAGELGSLREVVGKLIESQKSLVGPEIAAKVGEEVFKIIAGLNDRMVQLGTVIRDVREGQTVIVKLLEEGSNYKQVEGNLVQLRSQFAQLTEWIKRIAADNDKLLHRDEVINILKEQTGDIRLIKAKLAQFRNGIVRIVETQSALLRDTHQGNEGAQARDAGIVKRLAELRSLTEEVVNIQQIALNSDIYKIIPKEILSQVNGINTRLERFGPTVFELLNRQESLLKLTSAEKHEVDEIQKGVGAVSEGVARLLQEIRQIHEEQNIVVSQNKEVKVALDQQLDYLKNINGRLTNFASHTTEFLSQQAKLLEQVLATQEKDENGLGETLNRVRQLQQVVASIIHWQQSLNLPEIIGSLPRTLVDLVRDLSEKIVRLTGDVSDLSQQQRAIAGKDDKEYESVRQMLNVLNERIVKFGDALHEIASVQTKLVHDDRILGLLNNQSNQIQGLGININTIRKEITQLINQQQRLLEQGSGIHQGEVANLQKIGGNISYLTKVVDQLFKQQQLLANSQLLNLFPKRVIKDVEILNEQVRGLGDSVKEIRNLQAAFLNSQNRNNEITGDLAKNVQVISGKFNRLSESVRRILELQQAILSNEKVGPILEKFYGEFRGIDGRLLQLNEVVGHILENQQTLVTTQQFQSYVRENSLDDKKIFETLGNLRNTLRVLIEQQRDLVRPEMLNAVAKNLYEAIQTVGGRVSGLGKSIGVIQEEQNAVLRNQGQLNVNFEKSVDGLNKQLSVLNESVHDIFQQQSAILRDEQVLKVIAERLNDLEPIKHNLSGVNERLEALLSQQNDITQLVEKSYGIGTDISRQIINGFNTFSRSVRQLISKQTTLLSETIVAKAPKELLGQIVGLNRQFDIMNSGISKLFEIQKEILGGKHQEFPSEQVLSRLNLISQRFAELSNVASYIAKKQDDLMNREELLTILRQQSGAIRGVDIRVGQLGERVNSLIGQQRTLLGSIAQKLDKSGYSRDGFDAVLARLVGLEKGIVLVLEKQQRFADLQLQQGNHLDGKILESTRFLDEKLTRLTQVVDRLFEEQRALVNIVKENTEITKATFNGVEKLNNNLIHLDDAVQFLVKEAQNLDAKVNTLLGLPQDMQQVKARLARLSESARKLTEQHAQLFSVTSEGVDTLNQQQHVLSKDMNIRLSEITRLVDQLIRQQNQLMVVETKNSQKHTQEMVSLASKIMKIEEVVEFLLSEEKKLFTLNRNEQHEQFAKLDQKLNLFGDALKQLINQQHNVMQLAGLVEKQSIAINNMGGALENLNGVVARLVSQQQQLLVYTKEHDRADLTGTNGHLGQLKNTVANIINQHQVLLHREINALRSQENRNEQEITAHFDQRINQVNSLMTQLVREQDAILSHIKRQTLSSDKIVGAISRISGLINDLAQLTVRLNTEQTTLIERGFTQLSQQNNEGFKHMDDRLDTIGFALKKIAGNDANSLINRFEVASRQQSRENREIKSRLNQITKVLERIVTRPELIFPNHSRDFVDMRRRIEYLDQVMIKLVEIQSEGTARLVSLNEEQREKVTYLMNVIPTLNESVRRLGLLSTTDSHRFFEELSMIRKAMKECDNAILSLKETLNLNGFLVGSLVSPDINIDSLIKKGVYSKNKVLDRSSFGGIQASRVHGLGQGSLRRSYDELDSGNYNYGGSYTGFDHNSYDGGEALDGGNTSNDLHDGYDFHNGYWYPGNTDFDHAINNANKYSSNNDFSGENFNSLSRSIDESLQQAEKYAPKSVSEEDEYDGGSY